MMTDSATLNPTTTACRVCGVPTRQLFTGPLLRHTVRYEECGTCGYVQTEPPHWLDEAYGEAINRSDTGIMRRNERNVRLVVQVLAMLGKLRGQVVDCAGGYGLLVRMLRDRGVDARWSDRYCENLVARGFEADPQARADLLTAFEAMEHFTEPVHELGAMFDRSDHVLVSTDLIPEPAPAPGQWWYYGPEHGQHIGFFRPRTLTWMAQHLGLHVVSDGRSFHLFSRRPVPRWRWLLARHGLRFAPLVARLRLRSLVWSDRDRMAASAQTDRAA